MHRNWSQRGKLSLSFRNRTLSLCLLEIRSCFRDEREKKLTWVRDFFRHVAQGNSSSGGLERGWLGKRNSGEGFEERKKERREKSGCKEGWEEASSLSDMYDVEPLTRFGFGLLVYRIG